MRPMSVRPAILSDFLSLQCAARRDIICMFRPLLISNLPITDAGTICRIGFINWQAPLDH